MVEYESPFFGSCRSTSKDVTAVRSGAGFTSGEPAGFEYSIVSGLGISAAVEGNKLGGTMDVEGGAAGAVGTVAGITGVLGSVTGTVGALGTIVGMIGSGGDAGAIGVMGADGGTPGGSLALAGKMLGGAIDGVSRSLGCGIAVPVLDEPAVTKPSAALGKVGMVGSVDGRITAGRVGGITALGVAVYVGVAGGTRVDPEL